MTDADILEEVMRRLPNGPLIGELRNRRFDDALLLVKLVREFAIKATQPEAVVTQGEKNLFEAVAAALWRAKLAIDYASKHEDGRYVNVIDGVARAASALREVEVLHAELRKYTK